MFQTVVTYIKKCFQQLQDFITLCNWTQSQSSVLEKQSQINLTEHKSSIQISEAKSSHPLAALFSGHDGHRRTMLTQELCVWFKRQHISSKLMNVG